MTAGGADTKLENKSSSWLLEVLLDKPNRSTAEQLADEVTPVVDLAAEAADTGAGEVLAGMTELDFPADKEVESAFLLIIEN